MNNDIFALTRPSGLVSRSISPENPTGEPGAGGRATTGTGAAAARARGPGWKFSPSTVVAAHTTVRLADIVGSGVLQHLWFAVPAISWRSLVLRFSWDGADAPSVEVPFGDFFAMGWAEYGPLSSKYVVVAPYSAVNCFWPMPFRTAARVTLENVGDTDVVAYYSIDYGLGPVPDDAMYFHSTWRRSDPVADGIHELLDVRGRGRYVGTYLAVEAMQPGWWGEGEFKFFLDGDDSHPTICGTGTEDYFGGAWDFDIPGRGYTEFSTPYLGLHQVLRPDGLYESRQRFGMYRWHELDAVEFSEALRVTVQDLGWVRPDRYLIRRDYLATTSFWYAAEPGPAGSVPPTAEHLLVGGYPVRLLP